MTFEAPLATVTLTTLGGLIGGFLGAFFNRKAANLAEKADIAEITRLVENSKHEFNHKLETIKYDLSTANNLLISSTHTERDLIFTVADELFTTYSTIFDVSGTYSTLFSEHLKLEARLSACNEIQSVMTKNIIQATLSQMRLSLITNDQDLIVSTEEFASQVRMFLFEIKSIFSKTGHAIQIEIQKRMATHTNNEEKVSSESVPDIEWKIIEYLQQKEAKEREAIAAISPQLKNFQANARRRLQTIFNQGGTGQSRT